MQNTIIPPSIERSFVIPKPAPSPSEHAVPHVVELRNPREITRAVAYVEGELRAHLEVGTTETEVQQLIFKDLLEIVRSIGLGRSNQELSLTVDKLLSLIKDLDQASIDLLEGSQAQIAELALELETALPPSKPPAALITISEIDAELKRRNEARERIAIIQEHLEDERDAKNSTLSVLRQQLKADPSRDHRLAEFDAGKEVGSLEGTIGGLIGAIAENDRKVMALVTYKNALELVYGGLPKNIVGEKLFEKMK
jgi:hypothetical protein